MTLLRKFDIAFEPKYVFDFPECTDFVEGQG